MKEYRKKKDKTEEIKPEESKTEGIKTEEIKSEKINIEKIMPEGINSEEDTAEEIKGGEEKFEGVNSNENKTENNKDGEDLAQAVMTEGNEVKETKVQESRLGAEKTIAAEATNDGIETDKESGEVLEAETKRKPRKKWVVPLVVSLVSVLILLGGIYAGVGVYYQSHFLPNTEINGIDCSGLTALEAAALLDEQIQEYSLEVIGRDYATGEPGAVLGRIVPQDIQLAFVDMLGAAEEVLTEQDWLWWIRVLENVHYGYSLVQGVMYDDAMLESTVEGWDAFQTKNMLKAQDAYIGGYSEALQRYEIIPETPGTELDVKQVITLVSDAVLMKETTLDLEDFDLYGVASVLQDDSRLTTPVEIVNSWLGTNITYDWNGSEVVLDANTIRNWVTIEDGEAILDEDAVKDFVKEQSRSYDTYGKKKSFVTTLGVELNLNSPSYGWKTDTTVETEELIQLIREGSEGPREPVYSYKGMTKGSEDIGNSYVEADLTNQHLYLYIDGEVVLETDFVSGKVSNGNATPAGIYGITYKTRNAVLRGRDYATPVSYWMPFYGNYGMHDANWRGSFGGSIYITNGSHGCINLPPKKAEQIYDYMFKGFPVICYYYSEPVVPSEPDPSAGEPVIEPTVGEPVVEPTVEEPVVEPTAEEAASQPPVEGASA